MKAGSKEFQDVRDTFERVCKTAKGIRNYNTKCLNRLGDLPESC